MYVCENLSTTPVTSQKYKIFTVQPESIARQIFTEHFTEGTGFMNISDNLRSNIEKSWGCVMGKDIDNILFGWVGLGGYPIQISNLFSNLFFTKPYGYNSFRPTDDITKLVLIEFDTHEAALLGYDNNNYGECLSRPAAEELTNIIGDQVAVFANIKLDDVVDISFIRFEGILDSFNDGGRKYICYNFNPPKGEKITPELSSDMSLYVRDTLSIWTFDPIRKTGILDRPYTWAAGVSFGSRMIQEG